jgi:hypothetical protein
VIPIKRSLSLIFGAGIAAAALIPAAPISAGMTVTSWDAAADFSAAANPNGAWSYGWSASRGSAFNTDTVTTTFAGLSVWTNAGTQLEPDVFFNGTGTDINPNGTNPIPAGTLAFHPGPTGQNAVVRWSAPTSGAYNLTAIFTGRDTVGTTTDVAVLSNGVQLFGGEVTGFLATQSFVAGPLNLNAGDTIDFTVGAGTDGTYFYDSTGLSAQITALDVTPPNITITTPAKGARYVLNQGMLADYACIDPDDSTPVSCVGTVAAGGQIDTASVGSKTFTVVGTDRASNQATASVDYAVGYGICLLYDQTKAVHSGATVPIKLTLCDAAGVNQSSPDITLSAVGVTEISSGAPGVLDTPGNSQPDNNFRFDPDVADGGGYHFNLSTEGLATGTYVLSFMASGDPTVHLAQFQVK